MKKIKSRVCTAMLCVGLIAACSSPSEVADNVGMTSDTPTPPVPPQAVSGQSASEELERRTAAGFKSANFVDKEARDGGERNFEYSWPAQVSAIPELAQHLQQERATALSEQKREWSEMITDSPEDCTSCKNNSYARTWEVVADLPRFLSLSANQDVYTGGAHPNYWFDTLVWDREAQAVIDPRTMFTSTDALNAAVTEPYCAALNAERAKKRGGEIDGGIFDDCPSIDDLTLLVGSSDGKSFNRLGLLAAPYVAGPYVEGAYEITLPVTEAVIDTVKPEYGEAFSVK